MIETTKTGKTYLEWRAAQAWLAGYSDGLEDDTEVSVYETWRDAGYGEDYERGYDIGAQRRELRAA